ncbi:MAG: serine--tRNA ligase [Bryobacter sp.]|nr:serine--tRNA ligase [Bryobacter sp.]
MHDFQLFRGQLDQVAERLATRGFVLDKSAFRELDQKRRDALTEVERLKAERNERSKDIGARKKAGEDTAELQAAVRLVGDRIAELEGAATKFDEEFRDLLKGIPNLPHESVPVGNDEHDNVELRREGTPREMGFAPKAHWDLGVDLGILDFERAAKVTGARFAFYVGLGAKLERALINFMLDLHTIEHGYTETLPPFLVNSESLYGTGQLPKFAEDLFHCEGTDLWLAPTAEVPVTNFLRDETVAEEKLPVKLCAYTPCFRSEAGSHGRDVRGIIRQHQFQKVELVKFAAPETSMAELDALTNDAENVLRKLGLPFRTVVLCTGDMGFSSARTHDIEVWLPGQQTYKEISSCSNFEGFQARRAGIRYKAGKKSEYLHTLNGSGLAVGRTWVAIVENYQEADGSVVIPEALRPYLNAERITAGAALV